MEHTVCSEKSALKFRRRGITQKKAYKNFQVSFQRLKTRNPCSQPIHLNKKKTTTNYVTGVFSFYHWEQRDLFQSLIYPLNKFQKMFSCFVFVSLPSLFPASEVINFPASDFLFYSHHRYKGHASGNFSLMTYLTLVISLHARRYMWRQRGRAVDVITSTSNWWNLSSVKTVRFFERVLEIWSFRVRISGYF